VKLVQPISLISTCLVWDYRFVIGTASSSFASEDIEGIMSPELANDLAFGNSECTDDRC
jgi:hypothetical protein